MLKWYEEKGKYLCFDDDENLLYIVDYDATEGWRWHDIFEGWGEYGYDTAEEAKARAEREYKDFPDIYTHEPWYTPEEIEKLLES